MKNTRKIKRAVNKKIKKLSKFSAVTNDGRTIEFNKLILNNTRKVAELLMQASNSFGSPLKFEKNIFINPTEEGFLAIEVIINETNTFYVYVTGHKIDLEILVENLMSHKLGNLDFDLGYILERFNEFRSKGPNVISKERMFIFEDMTGGREKLNKLSPSNLDIFCNHLIGEFKKLTDVTVVPTEDGITIRLDTRIGTQLSVLVKSDLTSINVINEDTHMTRISALDQESILNDVKDALHILEY